MDIHPWGSMTPEMCRMIYMKARRERGKIMSSKIFTEISLSAHDAAYPDWDLLDRKQRRLACIEHHFLFCMCLKEFHGGLFVELTKDLV